MLALALKQNFDIVCSITVPTINLKLINVKHNGHNNSKTIKVINSNYLLWKSQLLHKCNII